MELEKKNGASEKSGYILKVIDRVVSERFEQVVQCTFEKGLKKYL